MPTGTIRPWRLFLVCVVAGWVGILLASVSRGGRPEPKEPPPSVPYAGPTGDLGYAARADEPPPPQPAPILPDVPIPPVVEVPKRDERIPPRVEPRPDPPPPPAPTLDPRAAYVKIVAALDGVEAAAIQKFGEKPRANDPVRFTIPFKVFVEERTRQVKKQLAKTLGLTEAQIDQIKREGDRAGWPKR